MQFLNQIHGYNKFKIWGVIYLVVQLIMENKQKKKGLLKIIRRVKKKIVLKYRSNRKDLKKRIKNMKYSPTTLNYNKPKLIRPALKNSQKQFFKV
jgi:hypothetical protein